MRSALLFATLLASLLASVAPTGAFCHCQRPKRPHCADRTAKHRVTINVNFAVVNESVEVLTQSGPYQLPVADLIGKPVLLVFMPRGQVFQGSLSDAVPGSLGVVPMGPGSASFTTGAIFAPGEYELALFIDVVSDGGLGPQRGDLAAFDNGVCDPTGVSVRVSVGCEDATVTLENRHFIIF